jgi:hypothetical protein
MTLGWKNKAHKLSVAGTLRHECLLADCCMTACGQVQTYNFPLHAQKRTVCRVVVPWVGMAGLVFESERAIPTSPEQPPETTASRKSHHASATNKGPAMVGSAAWLSSRSSWTQGPATSMELFDWPAQLVRTLSAVPEMVQRPLLHKYAVCMSECMSGGGVVLLCVTVFGVWCYRLVQCEWV